MKNWTVKEAVKVINKGTDKEAIKEIVKHFPLFAVIVAGKDFDGLAEAMPEHVTVRKIENELNNKGTDEEAINDEEVEESEEVDEVNEEDLSALSTKQLIALCDKKGIKVPKYGKNKQFYLDALAGNGEEENTDESVDEDEEEDDPVALYKKCKKAGLKVAPKKTAKYYKDALKKAEQEAKEAEDDEDNWDDDEEEEKPKASEKKSKASDKKSKAKPKTKPVVEDDDEDEDDEDDWDI